MAKERCLDLNRNGVKCVLPKDHEGDHVGIHTGPMYFTQVHWDNLNPFRDLNTIKITIQ